MPKSYIWNPATCNCKTGKYVRSIIDNSVTTCNEITKETKTISTKTIPTKSNLTKLHFTSLFINYHSIINSC